MTMESQPRKTRRSTNIGLLTTRDLHWYLPGHWLGVMDRAQEQGVNLFCFPGAPISSPNNFAEQVNVIFELVDAERLDGLIIWSAGLDWIIGTEAMRDFGTQFGLPVVSAETPLEGIPSVMIANYQGVYDAVSHLIEAHQRQRIAFLSGAASHYGAQERYRGYVEAITDHSLELDDSLVTPPNDSWNGDIAIQMLLDERKLRPGHDFDAIVAASDGIAGQAIVACQQRGYRVPGDVAVVGFDDAPFSRVRTPPITTVAPRFYQVGQQAVDLLLAQLRGDAVPEKTVVPSQLLIRESCGCLDPFVLQVVAADDAEQKSASVASSTSSELAISAISQAVVTAVTGVDQTHLTQLLESFLTDLENEPSAEGEAPQNFLSSWEAVLNATILADEDVAQWHPVLSVLRRVTLPYLRPESLARAEDLWQQARVMIGVIAQRVQTARTLQVEERSQQLRNVGAALITTFDVQELLNILAQQLTQLEIPGCYLSLYEDPDSPATGARLLLAMTTDRGRIALPSDGQSFSPQILVPEDVLPQKRQYSFVVEPLHFQEQSLGFVLFEVGPRDGIVYETLGLQISSALKGALLIEENRRAQDELQSAYVESTNLREEMAERLRELDMLQRAMTQEGWEAMRTQLHDVRGYMYAQGTVQPLTRSSDVNPRAYTVPMAQQDIVVGQLGVEEDPDYPLTNEERVLLASLSEQIAVALDRARLFEDTRRSAARDQIVSEVSAQMRTSLDIDTVLQTTIREIGDALNLANVEVRLGVQSDESGSK